MPKITLDGKTLEVEATATIIEAGDRLGIHIPRFCYHPHLTIDGNCRMCHDMVVRTDTDAVKKAVKGVLEFLLVHHPIDCPICDQSGECYLQDYYVQFGLYKSRFPLKDKIHKEKVKDIGGDIVLDAERCVLCTRCMRFLREVTGTDELNLFGRGSHSAIDIYHDQPLYNRYTCNLADICPVGALTSKDFRFQCRVWYLKEAQGCKREQDIETPDPGRG
jgi:NADH-quinone oxidoreductase subunit G